jgi:hypothetical protein
MANTQNLVGIDLVAAGYLADALGRAAAELAGQAGPVGFACATAGVRASPVLRLVEAGRWAEDQQRAVRLVLDRLRRLDGGRVARWTGSRGPAYADPVAAFRAAHRAVLLLADGDLGAAATLVRRYDGDPVFATVLVEALGVDGVVGLLRPAVVGWAHASGDERAVVLGVGAALAQAGRHRSGGPTIAELAAGSVSADLPLAALALLFLGGARFPTSELRDAVRVIVEPINRMVLDEPGLGVDPWLVPAPGMPLDARVVVLDAVARDPRAAGLALAGVDLDGLLPGRCAYLDGGVTLARFLLAGTAEAYNARRVIEWIGANQTTPLAVQLALGDLARPWIGSFRSAGLDGAVDRPLDLDEDLARAYLRYAQARESVGDDLREAAWAWAAAEVDRLSGPGFDGSGFDAVGSVLGMVTVTALDADAARAAEADERIRRDNELWRRVVGEVQGPLPQVVRRLAEPLVRRTMDRVLPEADHLLTHWQELRDPAVLHEALALDYLVASALWRHRDENGYFAWRPPPGELLLDPDHPELGLRPPLGLDEDDAEAWTAWRSWLATGRPAPMQLAGDTMLAETRQR